MEKILPAGTYVYKGYGNPKVGCSTALTKTKIFFVTQNIQVAREYASDGVACAFVTQKPMKLFVLRHGTIKQIEKYLSQNTILGLKFALGTNVTRQQQMSVYKRIARAKVVSSLAKHPSGRGERFSVTEVNTDVFARFAREYLIPHGYDGIFSPSKKTKFHRGVFPSEIVVFDASHTLVRAHERVPVLSRGEIVKQLPRLFIMYSRKNKGLLRRHADFSIRLGGGMGDKLFLQASGNSHIPKSRDFDFVFAVPRTLSRSEAHTKAMKMHSVMSAYLSGFVQWLNETYKGANARLDVKTFVPDHRYIPPTKKYVYQVFNYRLKMPGLGMTEFADASLAYVNGSSAQNVQKVYSRKYGLPIPTAAYLYKERIAVLASSFLYPGVKLRNPLYGRLASKGQRNVSRVLHLRRLVSPSNQNIVRNFIKQIQAKKTSRARGEAYKIVRHLQGKKP